MTQIPDFSTVAFEPAAGVRHEKPDGDALAHPRGHPRQAALRPRRPRRPRLPRHLPRPAAIPARPLPDHVRHPALDGPAVRRLLHGRGLQRLLPAQPRGGAEGPLRRLRPRHPPRLRFRPPARLRRRRHGRGGDRLDLRHAHPVLRHPARPDERVDDHERGRAARARALHRRGGGAGRRRPTSSRARSRTTSSRSSWSGTPTSTRPRARCGSSATSSPTRRRTCRSSTRSRSPATTCRRPGRRRTWSSPTRSPTASSTSAPASPPGSPSTSSRRACPSSGRSA